MNKTQRTMIYVAAASIFIWFNVATYLWVTSFDSVAAAISQTWNLITTNWMILIILSDSLIFLCLILAWLVVDAKRRGWTGYRRWGWIAAILALGSPPLIVYLVLRPDEKSREALGLESKKTLQFHSPSNRLHTSYR